MKSKRDLRAFIGTITVVLLVLALSGCAAMGSVTRKNESKFETTGLFTKPCKERTDFEKSKKIKMTGFGQNLNLQKKNAPRN